MLAHLDAIRKVLFTVYISFEAALDTCCFSSAGDVLRSLCLQKQHHLPLPLISISKTKGSLAACLVLVIYCSNVCTCNMHQFQMVCVLSCIHIGLFNLQNHAKSGCVQHSTIYTKRKVMMWKELHKNILIMFFFPLRLCTSSGAALTVFVQL